MAYTYESPIGSPLSDLSSDAFGDEDMSEHDRRAAPVAPARKRQKVSDSKDSASPPQFAFREDALEDMAISSDSSGEVPNSPGGQYRYDEDDLHEQVTACIWEGCDVGDLGDMDTLVKHIHNEHIETRGKKYPCEWMDCTRRGANHASAYALRAHMRSHTREKPFYCELPECDRAFTRSDALAKHYRTVHETEALRPSDPIPKSMLTQANRLPRIKPKEHKDKGHADLHAGYAHPHGEVWTSSYPSELGFTEAEEARGSMELYRLLRRQIKWAEEEGEALKQKSDELEELRKKEWLEKEFLLDQAIKGEENYHALRKLVKEGRAPMMSKEEIKIAADQIWSSAYSDRNMSAMSPAPALVSSQPARDPGETAAILASMHHQA